jgi:hypothetical protein
MKIQWEFGAFFLLITVGIGKKMDRNGLLPPYFPVINTQTTLILHALAVISSPLALVRYFAFIPLSRGGYGVVLGDFMLVDSVLG